MSKAAQDQELWDSWKLNPSPETMKPVMDALQPVVHRRVNEYFRAFQTVPKVAVQGYANALAAQAIQSYDPNREANLATWTNWQLNRIHAFVGKYQNVGYIPPDRLGDIQPFKEARELLTAKLGQDPSVDQLAAELNWSVKDTRRMDTELRSDLISSLMEQEDPLGLDQETRDRQLMNNLVYELNHQQRFVYEHSLGLNGKKKLSAGQISKALGVSPSKVSRLRNEIHTILKKHLD